MIKKKITAIAISAAAAVTPLAQLPVSAEDQLIFPDSYEEQIRLDSIDSDSQPIGTPDVKAPDSPSVYSAYTSGKTLKVMWHPINGVDGYVLYRYMPSTGSYDYFLMNPTDKEFTWDDYSEHCTGYRYYILSYIKNGDENVRSEAVDFTDGITDSPVYTTPDKVNYLKSSKSTKAVRIYWNKLECDGYEAYVLKNGVWTLAGSADGSADNIRIEGLASGTKYRFKIRAYNYDDQRTPIYGEYSKDIILTTKTSAPSPQISAPEKVIYSKSSKSSKAVRIYWNKQDCTGYEAYVLNNGVWTLAGTAGGSADNIRIEGLASGTKYRFRIRAYNRDNAGNMLYGEYSKTIVLTTKPSSQQTAAPAKVYVTKVNRSTKALRPYWNKLDCAGYEVYILKNGVWTLSGTATGAVDNFRIENLSANTSYSLRIRAFNKTANGANVYGDYSDIIKVSTKPVKPSAPVQTSISKINKSYDTARVFWNKVDCDGYEIAMKKDGSWSTVGRAVASSDNFRIANLKEGTQYVFKVRAYRLYEGQKIYGSYSAEKSVVTKSRVQIINGATYIDGILIVNKTYSLPSSYYPGGLTPETSAAFKKLQQAAWNDGISLWNASGFRSYSTQQQLYNNYVARDGKAAADRYSARPGYSEHQSGLALDVNNPSSSFNNTKEAKWLAKNCAKYGFIIRYPQGKENITGFMYESWHIRYVGKSLAQKLMSSGQTLEEYLGITSQYAN